MATAIKLKNYTAPVSYGSLAYDLPLEPEYAPEYEPGYVAPEVPVQPSYVPGTALKSKVRVETERSAGRRVSIVNIVGFAVVAVALLLVLLTYVQLAAVSESTVQLRTELSQLQEENARLQIRHASAFDLNEIEAYATTALGMVKPEAGQIVYVNGSAQDKAEIIKDSGSEKTIGGVGSLLEYLK